MSNVYCTPEQFSKYFDARVIAQLSNDTNSDTGDSDIIQEALDSAASLLDTYLYGRYTLPISNPPPILTRWVAMHAAADLYGRRGNAPDSLEKIIEQQDKWIEDVRERKASIPGVGRDPSQYPSVIRKTGSRGATTSTSRFEPGAADFDRRTINE